MRLNQHICCIQFNVEEGTVIFPTEHRFLVQNVLCLSTAHMDVFAHDQDGTTSALTEPRRNTGHQGPKMSGYSPHPTLMNRGQTAPQRSRNSHLIRFARLKQCCKHFSKLISSPLLHTWLSWCCTLFDAWQEDASVKTCCSGKLLLFALSHWLSWKFVNCAEQTTGGGIFLFCFTLC